jgi:hypothetical protein
VRELEGLVGEGDVRDLGAEEGQGLADEQEPEVAMAAKRPDVDGGEAGEAAQSARLLDDRDGRCRREPLGLVGRFEGAFAVDPRRLRAI